MSSDNGAVPDPEAPQVFPGLCPVQWRTEQITLTNSQGEDPILCVMLELRTVAGLHVTFWPEDTAVVLGQTLLDYGQATADGAVLGAEEGHGP